MSEKTKFSITIHLTVDGEYGANIFSNSYWPDEIAIEEFVSSALEKRQKVMIGEQTNPKKTEQWERLDFEVADISRLKSYTVA